MFSFPKPFLLALALLALAGASTYADVPLKAQKPIVLPGGAGGFDWMVVEKAAHRLFATHKGTKTLVIVDLRTEKIAHSVDGATQPKLLLQTNGIFPVFSPNGARIAFLKPLDSSMAASGSRAYEIYVVNADGTGETRVGTQVAVATTTLDWR